MTNPLFDALFPDTHPEDAVLLHLPDGGTWTRGQFLARSARIAHALTRLGVKTGDRVAAQIHKSPEALMLYIACVRAGFVFLPLNTAYTGEELGYFIKDSDAALFVHDAATDISVEVNTATLNADGSGTLMQLAEAQPDAFETVARGPDDLAALLYTSGTTGRSKGAMLSQNNLCSNAQALVGHWKFTSDDMLIHALPIFHTHGLFVATNVALISGCAMIFLPKFSVEAVLQAMPRATALMGVPTFYTRLLDAPEFERDQAGHMRLFVSGSAPLLAETHVSFAKRTGHQVLERYGMTETNMITSNPYDGERRAGTVGFPLPGVEMKITAPATGATLPDGEIGQIEVRGPNVFQGYWRMPEKTAEELRDDGFFITGDLGFVDADGYLNIVGRDKDLIISGGYNVYPKEIELVLDEQPGVLESAVVGVPHPDFGETPVGLLVPDGTVPVDPDAIAARIGDSLARFKHPSRYVVVDALPRNTMGKVQKNKLREMLKASPG